MLPKKLRNKSKTISYILRHNPVKLKNGIDEKGWANLDEVIQLAALTFPELAIILNDSDEKRFETKSGKIRAYYRHSTKKIVEKEDTSPPDLLYHCTNKTNAEKILHQGLKPMGRQRTHLSIDVETAKKVGKRQKGKLEVLTIMATEAHNDGIKFYLSNKDVWMSDTIPTKYIVLTR